VTTAVKRVKTPPPKSPLDDALWRARRSNKWLAEQIGVDKSHVSRWRNGLRIPEPRRIEIAKALGISPDELV